VKTWQLALSYNKPIGGFHDSEGNQPSVLTNVGQVDQVFKNVDTALRHAGGAGWTQVYRVNSFHISLDDDALEAMVRNFKEWMPDNYPAWTCVQVCRLGDPGMRVEIEVSAFDPVGARVEGTSSSSNNLLSNDG
jgi:enamine deaminase RidA (YjgF/YER057c/UK114 family)